MLLLLLLFTRKLSIEMNDRSGCIYGNVHRYYSGYTNVEFSTLNKQTNNYYCKRSIDGMIFSAVRFPSRMFYARIFLYEYYFFRFHKLDSSHTSKCNVKWQWQWYQRWLAVMQNNRGKLKQTSSKLIRWKKNRKKLSVHY